MSAFTQATRLAHINRTVLIDEQHNVRCGVNVCFSVGITAGRCPACRHATQPTSTTVLCLHTLLDTSLSFVPWHLVADCSVQSVDLIASVSTIAA